MRGEIINLDSCVIDALNLFKKEKVPKLNIKFKNALVVGSGNAAVTGKVIFAGKNYHFANESNYLDKIKNEKIDGCILISASGAKHAPIIAKKMKQKKVKTYLLTNTENSQAEKFTTKTFVFPKNPEPYTYNTSTYLGMILGKTKENPKDISKLIKKIKIPRMKKYKSFYIIVPEEFEELKEMFQTKFDELFGPKIQGRVFTYEQTKHAKTVVESKRELFIGLGVENNTFGINKLNFKLPKNAKEGTLLALGYYIIGKIQAQKPQWFKKSIEKYAKEASRIFGSEIKPFS